VGVQALEFVHYEETLKAGAVYGDPYLGSVLFSVVAGFLALGATVFVAKIAKRVRPWEAMLGAVALAIVQPVVTGQIYVASALALSGAAKRIGEHGLDLNDVLAQPLTLLRSVAWCASYGIVYGTLGGIMLLVYAAGPAMLVAGAVPLVLRRGCAR
jgi:hypothetical protein